MKEIQPEQNKENSEKKKIRALKILKVKSRKFNLIFQNNGKSHE